MLKDAKDDVSHSMGDLWPCQELFRSLPPPLTLSGTDILPMKYYPIGFEPKTRHKDASISSPALCWMAFKLCPPSPNQETTAVISRNLPPQFTSLILKLSFHREAGGLLRGGCISAQSSCTILSAPPAANTHYTKCSDYRLFFTLPSAPKPESSSLQCNHM